MTPEPASPRRPILPGLFSPPNLITLSRAGLSVVVFILIGAGWFLSALGVFIVAALTDALDGIAARRYGMVSALGRQLDPLVDKVMVIGAFIFLMGAGDSGLSPWIVTVIVLRELLIQTLRDHMEGAGHAFGAVLSGKLKTVTQCFAIGAILVALHWPGQPALRTIRDVLIWATVILTVWSGLVYLGMAWSKSRNAPPSKE